MIIKRILRFKSHDWRHVGNLTASMLKNLLKGGFDESTDAYMWIKIHLSYNSSMISKEDD